MSYRYWNYCDSDSDFSDTDSNISYKKKPFKQLQSAPASSANRKYPYIAEYAISSDTCRGCWETIHRGTLRLGVNIQSLKEDNKIQYWYDFQCFFNKQRPKNTFDIHNFESLLLKDQQKIKKRVGVANINILPNTVNDNKKGQKRGGTSTNKLKQKALKDFKIQYAMSGRAMCRGCHQKILKGVVRISKKSYDTEVGKKFDGQDMWHHVSCFVAIRSDLGYFESADKLPGFRELEKKDQELVLKELTAVDPDDPEIKKIKTEPTSTDPLINEEEYKVQNKQIFTYKEQLNKLSDKDLTNLLTTNNQVVPSNKAVMVERLADIMTFGALLPCKSCNGQLVFENGGYVCTGNISEWAKCDVSEKEPERKPFIVPKNLTKKKIADYVFIPRKRIIRTEAPTNIEKVNYYEPRVKKEAPPLYEMKFVIIGKPPKGKVEIKKQVEAMGGKLITKIDENIAAIISTPLEVEKMNQRMKTAEANQIHIVTDDFLDECKNYMGRIAELIIEKCICDWGTDPTPRLPDLSAKKYKSVYIKSIPDKVKMTIKGGAAVDPVSKLENCAHVYEEGIDKYTIVLGLTDIQLGKNSFHKIQLLEADDLSSYWIFESWGRIGTNIGDNITRYMISLDYAKNTFTTCYKEKTGNQWKNRDNFKKMPNKMYPIDIDYAEDDLQKFEIVESPSTLPTKVQELIRMIFDIKAMQKLMVEFELDTQKMPLGKLSKAQIQKAFGVLKELQDLIAANARRANFIDASNRFFTFIPHSFGLGIPDVLDNEDAIKKKLEMLNSLEEIQLAFSLMQTSNQSVDNCYSTLNTDIVLLDPNSEEFAIILEYVRNTHGATHNFKLNIEEVFTIKRHGEDVSFNKFKDMPNHKLLWHGSRATNFAGILSRGLRIAPPEAPSSGYMFGKGIYFADMVSKSAQYCFPQSTKAKGLLLLCDVALGNTLDLLKAENITKLPKGMNSVRALGKTHPDPSYVKKIEDIVVPVGKGIHQAAAEKSHLLYNEYIVYNVAQVNIKYLVKVNF
ncbi:poly [ADP-ribose] polymerase-like [Diorhabda carinulata]|uniref:poly [ADP-ribose] polymerase-like n=1 Tax=Diorhabda carinulata TaxID=1163345 RepID=UPI00259FFE93|nr:poly [ADP-ribose] polymerase-like [Diorhabda carinulata]